MLSRLPHHTDWRKFRMGQSFFSVQVLSCTASCMGLCGHRSDTHCCNIHGPLLRAPFSKQREGAAGTPGSWFLVGARYATPTAKNRRPIWGARQPKALWAKTPQPTAHRGQGGPGGVARSDGLARSAQPAPARPAPRHQCIMCISTRHRHGFRISARRATRLLSGTSSSPRSLRSGRGSHCSGPSSGKKAGRLVSQQLRLNAPCPLSLVHTRSRIRTGCLFLSSSPFSAL